jgi:hypothetical protein
MPGDLEQVRVLLPPAVLLAKALLAFFLHKPLASAVQNSSSQRPWQYTHHHSIGFGVPPVKSHQPALAPFWKVHRITRSIYH